jgi:hypothetical protein
VNRRSALVVGAFVLASTVGTEVAEAGRRGRVRFGGGGVRVTANVGTRVHWSSRPRASAPVRWSVGGRIGVRPYYPRYRYWRPYSFYYYSQTYVPSYYGSAYYPVAPEAAPAAPAVAAAVAPPAPPLPKLGLGLFAGGATAAATAGAAGAASGATG